MSDENLRALLRLNVPQPSTSSHSTPSRTNFGMPTNVYPEIESARPIHAQEEWDLNEAMRRSTEPRRTMPHRRTHRRDRDDDDDGGEDVPKEKWDKLEIQLKQLAAVLRQKEADKEQEIDPVRRYINRVDAPETRKTFDKKDFGFRILQDSRTEAEQRLIDQSNFEMLKFVYSKHPEAVEHGWATFDWGMLDVELYDHVDCFLKHHRKTSFRKGAFSVTMDFVNFPPKLTWRNNGTSLVTLRPVVVDGVAVLKATRPYDDLWRPFFGMSTEVPLYDELLNLPVKAIFEIILDFTIRGHKTLVYLPKYYKNYITDGGICKVDDLYAFEKLIEDKHIIFLENQDQRNGWNWFLEVSKEADRIGAVFVSTTEYRRRTPDMKYERQSERIITPCFWNTEDRVMVLEPSIRYKDKPEDKTFKVIPAEVVLQFEEPDDERLKLSEQLYLHIQMEIICKLCQLYPTGSRHKFSIQQLLHLVVRAESNFEMPGMDLSTYSTLFGRFQRFETSNLLNRLTEDNNSNNGFD